MLFFNATDPEKQTQLCIQKVDANSCLGELAPLRATTERPFSGSDKKEDDRKVTATNPAADRRKRNISLCPAKKKPSTRDRGEATVTTDLYRLL